MFWKSRTQMNVEATVTDTVRKILKAALDDAEHTLGKIRTINDLNKRVRELRESVETAEIKSGRQAEEREKKDREIEHKIGLERKRQEFEITQAKRETTVVVREENLEADKQRFKDEMEFQRDHLQTEIKSLRDLVNNMLKRLPSAEIYASLGDK